MADHGQDDPFLARLLAWARPRDDLAAVLLTGSRARGGGAVDVFSDYDVEIYTARPERYPDDLAWLGGIAEVAVGLAIPGDPGEERDARLVFFADGTKVDFQILPLAALDRLASGLDGLHERGFHVLLDRDGRAARLPAPTGRPPVAAPPSASQLAAVCAEFWFEASVIPRALARGELWVAKHRDRDLKELLGRVVEWQAVLHRGPDLDVWHIGTRMRVWAVPETWERLHAVFGHFDAADSWRAHLATTDLFRDVSADVAARAGLPDPRPQADAALRLIHAVGAPAG